MSDTPALENFLSAYFHQDWSMEHDTADGVVDAYLGSEADVEIVAVRDDLAGTAAPSTPAPDDTPQGVPAAPPHEPTGLTPPATGTPPDSGPPPAPDGDDDGRS